MAGEVHAQGRGDLVQDVTTCDEVRQAQLVRKLVLELQHGFPHEVNVDGDDDSAHHVLMLDGERPVGTARLTETSSGEGMIARIAVVPSHRGYGLGEGLIRELEGAAVRLGLRTIRVEPHAHLAAFFERQGYVRTSGPFTLGSHELIRMTRGLPFAANLIRWSSLNRRRSAIRRASRGASAKVCSASH